MLQKHPESPPFFDFIVTPETTQTPPKEDCGVRTTTVSTTALPIMRNWNERPVQCKAIVITLLILTVSRY